MNDPVITVIVPVYKAEEFLSESLDSILNQTFKQFELLLVDDASPDNSGSICDQYASNDPRIRVFHEEKNGGESSARNKGLENARGKYIVFVDADDRVLPNYLRSLYYSDAIPEGTLVRAPVISENNGKMEQYDQTGDSYFIDDLPNAVNKRDFLFAGPAWSKLLEVKLINDNKLRFKTDIKMNVDHTFHLEYLTHIKAFKHIDERNYIYVQREGSLSKKHFPFEELFTRLKYMVPLTNKVIEHFNIHDEQLKKDIYFTPVHAAILSVFSLYREPFKKNKQDRIALLKNIKKNCNFLFATYYQPRTKVDIFIKNVLSLQNYYLMDMLLHSLIWARYTLISKLKGK